MKKKILFLMALLAVSLLALAEMTVYVYKKDGTKVPYVASTVDSIGFVDANINANGHEWVDLGLPSGTLWATCNVGANSPEDYGEYFAWGETTPKSTYNWSTYKWCKGRYDNMTKYCTDSDYGIVDNKTTLDLSDDAAYVNWGGDWCMPTRAELEELKDNCASCWVTQNGVKGCKIISNVNGNSIFLPAAGYRNGSDLSSAGSNGDSWSSSLYTYYSHNASYLYFDSDDVGCSYDYRSYGRSVRPVIPKFYSITFDSNEGAGSMDVFKIKSLGSDVLPKNEFIRDGYFFYGWNTKADGTGTHYVGNETISLEADMTLYAQWAKISEATTTSGHEWVDLGLPSGTRWATCNIGASQPEIVGSYFRWSYQASGGTSSNPQIADGLSGSWGSDWRTPTKAEQDELANDSYTNWYAYTLNGVDGYLIISKINGNNIFLPKAERGTCGYECSCGYWNSSVYKKDIDSYYKAYYISYMVGNSTTYRAINYDADCTRQVRPVLNYNITITFDANGASGTMDDFFIAQSTSKKLPKNEYYRDGYYFTCWNTAADGSGTAYTDQSTITPTANITLYAQWEAPKDTGIADGNEWVDLGLPSGTKWATMNVGADSPEEYGDYFAWGETTPKSKYAYSNYYYSSNPTTLPLDRDAAYTNWGTSWRMPTSAELKELKDNCTWTWTTQNGVNGYKVTSKINGNSIFLPAAGYRDGFGLNEDAGNRGYYWSSSLYTNDSGSAYYLRYHSDIVYSGYYASRDHGYSVRPVLAK